MEHIFSLYRCGRAYGKERRVPRIYPTYNICYSWSQDLSKRLSFYRHARLEWEYKYLECDGSEKNVLLNLWRDLNMQYVCTGSMGDLFK